MGTAICCAPLKNYKSSNLHLYQINRYNSEEDNISKVANIIEPSPISESRNESEAFFGSAIIKDSTILDRLNSEPVNININLNPNELKNKRKQTLRNKNGEFQLLSYDIEEEKFSKFNIIFPIIKSIEGLSELYVNQNFYLCGVSPKQKNEGSFLFKINLEGIIEDEDLNAQILINSKSPHIYPSLISDKNEQIICVGGKGQTNCELYNCNLNKWHILPNLPEERYKCNLCLEPKKVYVYLFGGISTKNKKNKSKQDNDNQDVDYKILRMDLINQLVWETILIKNDNKSLIINRFSAGCFTFKNIEDFIFIVGGEDHENKYLDSIIRYSIHKNKFESTGIKLKFRAKFMNQYGLLNEEQIYCFIDNYNQIHEISRHDCLPLDYHSEEI